MSASCIGGTEIDIAPLIVPVQAGCRSRSSGRAVATTSSGTPRAAAPELLDEGEHRLVGPVHVLEDQHGRAGGGPGRAGTAARPPRSRPGVSRSPGTPISGPSALGQPGRVRVGELPQPGPQPRRAARAGSSTSGTPTQALTMSASAAQVTFSPNGGHCPTSQVTGGPGMLPACRASSRSSRLLPTPAGPNTVTNWEVRSVDHPVQRVDQQAALVLPVHHRGQLGAARVPVRAGPGRPARSGSPRTGRAG